MFRLAFTAMIVSVAASPADDDKGVKVKYTLHTGHFERNDAGLTDEPSLLLIANQKRFDAIFGSAFTRDAKPKTVPNGAFEKKIVAAVIHRGNAIWKYEVEKATVQDGTLTIHYKGTAGKPGTANFATPLMLSVDKGAIKKVVFVENGKDIGSATLEK